jgi:WD40 repeat protein
VIQYDLTTGEPKSKMGDIVLAHEDSCLRLSIHPRNDQVLLTAGQDWLVKLWDMRTRNVQGSLERFGRRQNYVQFNPTNPYLFVTSDDRGGMLLYDLRSAFSQTTSTHLIEYTTRLCKEQKVSRPADVTSAVFDSTGNFLCSQLQRWLPTLYQLNDPDPLCVFGEPSFSSLATVKIGSFCDTLGEPYFIAGSDNATAFGWEMPSLGEMLQERTITDHALPNEISKRD